MVAPSRMVVLNSRAFSKPISLVFVILVCVHHAHRYQASTELNTSLCQNLHYLRCVPTLVPSSNSGVPACPRVYARNHETPCREHLAAPQNSFFHTVPSVSTQYSANIDTLGMITKQKIPCLGCEGLTKQQDSTTCRTTATATTLEASSMPSMRNKDEMPRSSLAFATARRHST